jgi:hypothetical protein
MWSRGVFGWREMDSPLGEPSFETTARAGWTFLSGVALSGATDRRRPPRPCSRLFHGGGGACGCWSLRTARSDRGLRTERRPAVTGCGLPAGLRLPVRLCLSGHRRYPPDGMRLRGGGRVGDRSRGASAPDEHDQRPRAAAAPSPTVVRSPRRGRKSRTARAALPPSGHQFRPFSQNDLHRAPSLPTGREAVRHILDKARP